MARLERCTQPMLAYGGRWITELAKKYPHDLQTEVQETLAYVGWMCDHGACIDDNEPIKHLHDLECLLASGQSPLSKLEEIRQRAVLHVRARLRDASQRSDKGDILHTPWSLEFAQMLLAWDGTTDPAIRTIVEEMLTSDDLDWLPKRNRSDYLRMLPTMLRPEVLDMVDQLSRIDPVHASVQSWLGLRSTPARAGCGPRYALAFNVLQGGLLTFAFQRDNAGLCWHVAHSRDLQLSKPCLLLEHIGTYLRHGFMAFPTEDGGVEGVVPDPYPAKVMQWVHVPRQTWEAFSQYLPWMIRALQHVLPERKFTGSVWETLIRSEFDLMLRRSPEGVRTRDLIERLIGLPSHFIADASRPIGALPVDRLAEQSRLWRQWTGAVEICGWVPTLALMWQSAVAPRILRRKLEERAWRPVEKVLLKAMPADAPPSVRAHVQGLGQRFLVCATALRDSRPGYSSDSLSLHLRVAPVTQGHGVPVHNGRQFVEWLLYFSREVARETANGEPQVLRSCLAFVESVLRNPEFLARVSSGNGTSRQSPWLFSAGETARGDLEAEARWAGAVRHLDASVQYTPGMSHFVDIHVENRRFRVGVPEGCAARKSARHALCRLIGFARQLDEGCLPFDLRQELEGHPGLIVGVDEVTGGSHRMSLLLTHPSIRTAWQTQARSSPSQWVYQNLKEPMQEALEQTFSDSEAGHWVGVVLKDRLKRDADADAIVGEVLAKASGDAPMEARYSLKSLVSAIRWLSQSRPDTLRDPRGDRLATAILNKLPGKAPVVVYAHANWEPPSSHLAYWIDPFTMKVVHGEGELLVDAHDRWSFVFCTLRGYYVF